MYKLALDRRTIWVGLFAAILVAGTILFGFLSNSTFAQDGGAIMYPENDTGPVATYTATDPEGAMVKWSLDGDDASDFMIDNGVLSFKKSPDYEKPMGGTASPPTSNTYTVMVKATDETRRVASKTVMVKVTNVDEAGKVTLSARRPQTDTAFTASVSDPDGGVGDEKWQWAKAGSKSGTYRDIDKATSETYTPKDADSSSYLRATATYEDGEGEGKTAIMVSELPSQRITGGNNAPEFDDDQDPVMDGEQNDAKRSVVENTAAGKTVGSPVVATDDDGDTLTYTLTDADGGTDGDSASFSIDWGTGQILTKGKLNHEDTNCGYIGSTDPITPCTYTVVVRATDPTGIPGVETAETANSGTVTVMVTVTGVNEAPAVSGVAEVTFDEVGGDIDDTALGTYMADDPDADAPPPTWSVGGADGSKFNIGNEDGGTPGELKFKKKPNYEKPTDANEDNVYEVTVQASDGKKTGTRKVMVTVANAEEPGMVTLDKLTPVVGIPVTAELEDPDGGISKLTWQWSISSGAATTAQGDIDDATSDTYKPKAGDVGGTLTATARYFDGESAPDADATDKKTAPKAADNEVERDTRNKPPVFDLDEDEDGDRDAMVTRKVEENTEAIGSDDDSDTDATGDNVGAAVTATDTKADGTDETLTYSLGGDDAAKFRVRDNGQIEVAAGTELNYETKSTYMVTVMARDPLGASSSIPVTIMVTGVDEAPDVTGDEEADYSENDTGPVATYTATDPEGAMVKWSLDGDDASDFMIDNGVLSFKKSPDYEKPMGGTASPPTSNTYTVMVKATDETRRVASKTVMVKVTNVDEAGKVTLSARRPQTDTVLTAMITDPDGSETDTKWQWAKAGSKSGTYRDIDKATSETYTPKDADSSSYLRATVTYEDGEGEGKTAIMVSELPSQRITGGNNAPEFDDDQDPVMDGDQTDAKRSVVENTAAGKTVGSPVVATDDDGDTLTYTLTGNDASYFDIDWGTGQILTKSKLDAENGDSALTDRDNSADGIQLEVMVRATDPSGIPSAETAQTANSGTVTVMVTVTGVNEAPAVSGVAEVTFDEVGGDIDDTALGTYMADDPDADAPPPTWSVGGADGSKFNIGNETDGTPGELKFKKKPNYEKPTDANEDNVYEVTVQASDGKKTGTRKVMVTVANAEEPGMVTLDKLTPVVGIPVTAELEDPDGGISKLTWQWSISSGAATTAQGDIDDATSDTYKPKAGDVGGTLTATARYFDGESAPDADATDKKTAPKAADNEVERDTRNKPPVFDLDEDEDGDRDAMVTRKVEENTEAIGSDDDSDTDATGDNVGAAVTATDTKADGTDETLTYSLGGDDAAKFRVRDNGQIEVAAGTELNYETKSTYMVTVMARDPLGASASIPVTIMVTDVDEAPEIMLGGLAISGKSSVEYAENRQDAVATYTAAGPESANAQWTLEGSDAGDFRISSSGVLTFVSAPDYETKSTYMVTVKADDSIYMDTRDVTVMVTNVDEDGMVTLSTEDPRVGTAITATLTDADGGVTGATWQWASSSDMSAWADIQNATSNAYTPVDGDAGSYLRATANYTDGEGSGKSAMEMSAQPVTAANNAPVFAAETAERSVAENTVEGMDIGDPVTATDADADDTLTYTLGGDDMASFAIDSTTGQLMTMAALDFETKTSYSVTVTASDGKNEATVMVTIMVTNVGLGNAYDADDDGVISRAEAVNAVADFFDGRISREEALAVVAAFFG